MPNILILGGGFGGIRVALDLAKKCEGLGHVKITLVDRNNEQTFQPALYEVASVFGINHQHPYHTKIKGTVSIPYGDIFRGSKVETIQAEINKIDIANNYVTTNGGEKLTFDYLVIALGSVVSTFDIPGVSEYAYKFKTLEDSLILADKIEAVFKNITEKKQHLPIRILIGGAGFTGIELAGELSSCAAHIAHRHSLTDPVCSNITLIEAAPKILPMVSDRQREVIRARLNKLGVTIKEDSPIAEVGQNYVKLKNGLRLNGDLVIWSGGIKPTNLILQTSDLMLDERGRIKVDEALRLSNSKNIFAIGDAIIFVDPKTSKPVPQMAFMALEQGRVAAENIYRLVLSQKINSELQLKNYVPVESAWVAPVGGKYAVANVGGKTYIGLVGFLIRELVDLKYFIKTLPLFTALKLFFTEIKTFTKND